MDRGGGIKGQGKRDVDLCHAMGPWCVPGRGPWEERVANSCAFGLAGYLSNKKESAHEGTEVT